MFTHEYIIQEIERNIEEIEEMLKAQHNSYLSAGIGMLRYYKEKIEEAGYLPAHVEDELNVMCSEYGCFDTTLEALWAVK